MRGANDGAPGLPTYINFYNHYLSEFGWTPNPANLINPLPDEIIRALLAAGREQAREVQRRRTACMQGHAAARHRERSATLSERAERLRGADRLHRLDPRHVDDQHRDVEQAELALQPSMDAIVAAAADSAVVEDFEYPKREL